MVSPSGRWRARCFEQGDEFGQFGDRGVDVAFLRVERVDPRAAAVDRELALRAAPVADIVEVDHLADLGQREADALAAQDPGEPRAVAVRIDALRAAPLGRDQPFVLVEAQRAGGDAELGRQVGDREISRSASGSIAALDGTQGMRRMIFLLYVYVNATCRRRASCRARRAAPPPPTANRSAARRSARERRASRARLLARIGQRAGKGDAVAVELRVETAPGALVSSTCSVSPARVASPDPLQK